MRAVPIFDGGGAAGGEIGRSRGRKMDLLRGDWWGVLGSWGIWGCPWCDWLRDWEG